jgi:conjugal transfer pilus assembly protein TraA
MKNILKNKTIQIATLAALGLTSVQASTVAASDDFFIFYEKVDSWATSGLAVGLSLATLIVGAGMGVAKASPMPALGGLGLAAFFAFGPGLIKNLILSGSVLY